MIFDIDHTYVYTTYFSCSIPISGSGKFMQPQVLPENPAQICLLSEL